MHYADIFRLGGAGFHIYLSEYGGGIEVSNEKQLIGAKSVLHSLDYTFRGWKTGVNIPNEIYYEMEKAGILKFDNDGWYMIKKIRVDFQDEE